MDAGRPLTGFFYPFKGLRFLISHPRLLTLIVIPVGINTVLFTLLIWFTSSRITGWIQSVVPGGEAWYRALLYYALLFVAALVVLIALFYTFTLLGNLMLAPFNEMLSERVELIYGGKGVEGEFSVAGFVRDMARSYKAEGGRILLYLTGFVLLLLFNLVPVLGQALYGLLATLYSLFFLCWEFIDYSMERWRFTFTMKRKAAFTNVLFFLSFGAGAALLLLVPLANLMVIPVCVAGATLLFCDLRKMGRLPEVEKAKSV